MLKVVFACFLPALVQSGERSPLPAAPSSSDSASLVFHGRVFDRETLQPIPNIELRRSDGECSTKTDDAGAFEFLIEKSALGGCKYQPDGSVSCSSPDPQRSTFVFADTETSPVTVSASGKGNWNVETSVIFWRPASLRGHWVDAGGVPVANTALKVHAPSSVLASYGVESFVSRTTVTDADGAFAFQGLPSRVPLILEPKKADHQIITLRAPELVLTPGDSNQVTVCSPQTRRIVGTVRDSHDHALPRASVWLISSGDAFLVSDTNSSGAYEFERVQLGEYELKVMWPQEYDAEREGAHVSLVVAAGEEEVRADLTMSPMLRITGRLLDVHHRPTEGEVWFGPEAMPYSGRVDTAKDGSFELKSLFSGDCRVVGTGAVRPHQSELAVFPAGSTDVELILGPAGSLRGRVVGMDPSKDKVTVKFMRKDVPKGAHARAPSSIAPERVTFDRELKGDNTFNVAAIPLGQWSVDARSASGLVSPTRYVTLTEDKETACPDLVLERSFIAVLIAAPNLRDLEVEFLRDGQLLTRARINDGGLVKLALPAGSLRIVAKAMGAVVCDRMVTAAPGSEQLIGLGFAR